MAASRQPDGTRISIREARWRPTSPRTLFGAAAVILAVATATVGCTSGSGSSSAGGGEAALATSAPAPADPGGAERNAAADQSASVDGGVAPEVAGDAAAAPAPLTVLADGREVIRTAALSVELTVPPAQTPDGTPAADQRDADAAARRTAVEQASTTVRGIATSVGGFVAGAEGSGSSMTVTLRVPADTYDAVLDRVAAIGEVTSRTESAQDVTTEIVDVNSRVETMTASVARVRALLAEATELSDVIAIESELAAREANLESLKQQQAYLAGQVALSTVTVDLTAVTDGPGTGAEKSENGFLAGLAAGWSALLDFFTWIGAALGALLPFLPLLLAAGVLAWWLVRRLRRRRTASAVRAASWTDGAPAGPPVSSDTTGLDAPAGGSTGAQDRVPVG